MKNNIKTYLLNILILTLVNVSFSQLPQKVLVGDITGIRNLSRDTIYILNGFVNVKRNAIINIQPGTIIMGDSSSRGTLIIERGGKIYANGTPNLPIVFTSRKSPGKRNAGDWGGIILCGVAGTNLPGDSAAIEGAGTIFGPGSSFSRNDDDSSGVLRYVRIEFAGVPFAPNNEINGLTMGGVGRKTLIEYVQVSFANDDSFEWFGGTVNAKYLIAYKGLDDDFDTDNGYRGKLQFLLSIRDPNIADVSQSNSIEADNDATGSTTAPRSRPIVSNLTSIGPAIDSNTIINSLYRRAAHLRRATFFGIYNSVFIGWPIGLFIDGTNTGLAASQDSLQIRNTIFAGKLSTLITTNVSGFDVWNWYHTPSFANASYPLPSNIMLNNPFGNANSVDPRPAQNSPLWNKASFINPLLNDPFFINVNYSGAFGNERWDHPWANYDPQNTQYLNGITNVKDFKVHTPHTYNLSQNYPNPFNPITNINFRIESDELVTMKIFNIYGEEVAEILNKKLNAGDHTIQFDATGLSSGIYFYKLSTPQYTSVKKMILLK